MSQTYSGKTMAEWYAMDPAERPAHINLRIEQRAARRAENAAQHAARYDNDWARIKAKGDKFFREIGALDEEGNFTLTADVPKAYLQKALYVLNDKLEEGSLEAVKIVIPLVNVEAPKPLESLSPEELRERREREQERILSGLSPEARTEVLQALQARRKALAETN